MTLAGALIGLLNGVTPVAAATVELTIRVPVADSGTVYVALFDNANVFPAADSAFRTATSKVASSRVEMQLTDLASGTYAAAAFQDLDSDGNLSTNLLGIPTEPYGFSNATGDAGRPEFEEAAFELPDDRKAVTVDLR